MNGINTGDIVSSGAPQMSKDGSFGRNTLEISQSRRNKSGITPSKHVNILLFVYFYRHSPIHAFVFLLSVSVSTEELPFPVEASSSEHVETSKALYINSTEALPSEQKIDQNRNSKGEVAIMLMMRRLKSYLLKLCYIC